MKITKSCLLFILVTIPQLQFQEIKGPKNPVVPWCVTIGDRDTKIVNGIGKLIRFRTLAIPEKKPKEVDGFEMVLTHMHQEFDENIPFKLMVSKGMSTFRIKPTIYYSEDGFVCNQQFCNKYGYGTYGFGICKSYYCSCSGKRGANYGKCENNLIYEPNGNVCDVPQGNVMCGWVMNVG